MGVVSDDNDKYANVYGKYLNEVYKLALIYSENQHTAEDIAQEAFCKFYTNKDNINPKAARWWLMTTAKRMALNYKRSGKYEVLVEEVYDKVADKIHMESPEEEFIVKLYRLGCEELLEKILDDLYHINSRWYDALTITYLLEKPQKEVAENMNVSIDVLYSMLYRAKKWIHKNYLAEYERLKRL